jgi:hypothetical protein
MATSIDQGTERQAPGGRTLEPSDFTFFGFGELRSDEQRKIRSLSIRDGQPLVSVAENAIFVPSGFQPGPDQPTYAGGIVTAEGQPIGTAQLHRRGGKRHASLAEPLAVTPRQEVEEEVVYLGLLFNHYGRVLLESLARLWYLDQIDPSVKVVFGAANAAQASLSGWLPPLLAAFGLPPERILLLDAPTRLRRAIVPEPLFEQLVSAHAAMIRPFREVAARIAGDLTPSRQPLYLSRRLLSSRQRAVIGEAELEDVLRENGFLVANPETMTFADQVRLINGHTDIFSCIGSAAHNVLFALHQPRLHLLTSRDDLPANYFLCSALAETPTTFVAALTSGGRTSPNIQRKLRRFQAGGDDSGIQNDPEAGQQSAPELVDMPRVAAYLEANGLLRNRLRASLAARDPSLQRRFDEAWLYARVRKASGRTGTLPPEIEEEAVALSDQSWPLSLMLARYYARARAGAQTEQMAMQFVDLAANERDINRLAHFRGDVESIAPRVMRQCGRETANRMSAVLADRFLLGAREGDERVSG